MTAKPLLLFLGCVTVWPALRPIRAAEVDKSANTPAADTASASPADSSQTGKQFYEYIAYPTLQILIWPVEKILTPAVKVVLFPTKQPLRYILNEKILDRGIELISFGSKDQIMVYPTLNLAPGTGSNTGLTFRDQSLFSRPTERMVVQGRLFVNGDWKLRSYIVASELAGTKTAAKVSLSLNRVKNTSVNQPGTNRFWFYSDSSEAYALTFAHPLVEKLSGRISFTYSDNSYGNAPPQEDSLQSGFFRNDSGIIDRGMRGLNQDWADRILSLGLGRDTRNNENITLAGSDLRANWSYHFTDARHDYHNWEASWVRYFKLGKERYEISALEERNRGNLDISKVLEKLEYQKIREEIFNRKVVALRLFAAQSYEVRGNRMPVYGLQTLGNDTPMRGYSGSRFRDYTVASFSTEYRFPMMRLVDGVLFDEYGVYGRSWDRIDYSEVLKNSWGFGIRVRRPDIFLFRAQLGFHGLHGIQLNLSVDAPY